MYKILKSFKGSPDGMQVIEYQEGTEVELPASLVEVALAEKWAKKIKVKTQPEPEKAESPEAASNQSGDQTTISGNDFSPESPESNDALLAQPEPAPSDQAASH